MWFGFYRVVVFWFVWMFVKRRLVLGCFQEFGILIVVYERVFLGVKCEMVLEIFLLNFSLLKFKSFFEVEEVQFKASKIIRIIEKLVDLIQSYNIIRIIQVLLVE